MENQTKTRKDGETMPVTDLLERNHKLYSDEVALVELNPMMKDHRKTTLEGVRSGTADILDPLSKRNYMEHL